MKIEWVGNSLSLKYKMIAKKSVKATLEELEQDKRITLCINIVDADEMRELNNRTRGIDKVTDVLSFPARNISPFEKVEVSAGGEPSLEIGGLFFIGDMAICMEEVLRQTEDYNESKARVFARLVIHSVLHLLGFDHISDADHAVMEPIQNKILNMVVKK